ncbi:MAG TPA: right-handed parallel beta-helix repeat-containing protein, partial [Hymenobacter sp.]|nr:right-handed parallel beta-helix repeat-containing protein [Hymenobacter sp.]
MIPNGQARPGLRAGLVNQLSAQGVAVITPQSYLGDIVGAGTAINGLTQTHNVGNTNDVLLGTGGTVGVDNLPLSRLNGPEVRVQGALSIAGGLRFYNAPNVEVSGLSVYGFGGGSSNGSSASVYFNACPSARVSQNVLAPSASGFGTDPGPNLRGQTDHLGIVNLSGIVVTNNLIGFAEGLGISLFSNVTNATINNNEFVENGKDASVRWHDNIGVEGGSEISITGNRLAGAGGRAIDIFEGPINAGPNANCLVSNNTVEGNGQFQTETAGISLRLQGGWNIVRNIVRNNVGAGVQISGTGSGIRISQNSIYGNGQVAGLETGQVGIDLNLVGQSHLQGEPPHVTYNDDGDSDNGGNNCLNYPVLETATISGGVLTLRGFAPQGAQVEVYLAQPNTLATGSQVGNNFGQGKTFLFSRDEGSGQDLDGTTGSYGQSGAFVNGFFQGTETNQNRFRFVLPLSNLTAAQQAALSACGTQLTATGTVSGATSEFSGIVAITPEPVTVRITGNTPLCAGTTVRLSTGPRSGFLYTWYNGTTVVNGSGAVLNDSVFVASTAGTYTVQLTPAGCAASGTTSPPVSITVLPALTAGTIGADQTLCAGEQPLSFASLTAANGGTGTYVYQWETSVDNTTW